MSNPGMPAEFNVKILAVVFLTRPILSPVVSYCVRKILNEVVITAKKYNSYNRRF